MAGNEREGKEERRKRRRMMLLLRRRKSDHSPPFFSAKALRVYYIPQLHQCTTEHISAGRDQAKKRDGMESGGKRGYLEEEEAFFSRGESLYNVQVYSPMFLGVRREKRKGLYIHPPKPDLFSAADVRN